MVLMYDDWLQIYTSLQDRIKRGNQMLEILYRIYEVADPETAKQNSEKDFEFSLFEVIEIVPPGCNILEREKYWIQKFYKDNPEKSLNMMCTKGVT